MGPNAPDGCDVIELLDFRCLEITGPDASAFCQSQLTIDVDTLIPERWHPCAWCNAQGKVRAILLIRVTENGCDWVAPTSQIEDIRKGLMPYTIGRKVAIGSPLPIWGGTANLSTNTLSFDPKRCLSTVAKAEANSQELAPALWHLADIDAGLAWLTPDLAERFLPQALGLERLRGLSYTKGCFPGQEVIAKVHYRGRPKHRLVRLHCPQKGQLPDPNSDLFVMASPNVDNLEKPSSRPVGVVLQTTPERGLAVVGVDLPTDQPLTTQDLVAAISMDEDFGPLSTSDPVS